MINFIKEIIKRELIKIKNIKDFKEFLSIKNKNKVLYVTE